MSNRTVVPRAIPPAPVNVETLFARPPLLSTEDPQVYSALYRKFTDVLKPADVFECIWLHDIVHLTWDIQRLRCLSADFVSRAAGGRHGIGEDPLGKALEAWREAAASNPTPARAPAPKVPRISDPQPTTRWELAAAFADNIETYERIDALLTSAELRRNALLREIEHRRETFASRLRAASDEIAIDDLRTPDRRQPAKCSPQHRSAHAARQGGGEQERPAPRS